jgi:hypothetical protein
VDVDVLRETLQMNGIFPKIRKQSWQLLLGYLEEKASLRPAALEIQRKKYFLFCAEYFREGVSLSADQTVSLQQISVDVPRTNCKHAPLYFGHPRLAEALTRVNSLFI